MVKTDPAQLRDLEFAGLPPIDTVSLGAQLKYRPPWWATLARFVGPAILRRHLEARFLSFLAEAVRLYDRQIQTWLTKNVKQVLELYRVQADSAREQLRHLTTEADSTRFSVEARNLEADLRELENVELVVHAEPVDQTVNTEHERYPGQKLVTRQVQKDGDTSSSIDDGTGQNDQPSLLQRTTLKIDRR
jgi:hypothetical protein